MRTAILLIMLALTASALGAQAQERIRFQGRLTTPAGAAITTATDVAFRFYTTPTGGTPTWAETHSGASAITPSATGVFTVELGAIQVIGGTDFSQPVYVGITVGTDAEMTPRYLLTSSAHAHHAKSAATLGGLARTGFAELTGATFTGQVTATQFNGSGAGLTNLPSGQLTGALPVLNGSALTNVNAATLGGLARTGFAELTGATYSGQVTATQFNGSGAGLTSIPAGQLTGALPALNGAALTNVNAATLGGLARTGFAELTGATFSGGLGTSGTFTSNGLATLAGGVSTSLINNNATGDLVIQSNSTGQVQINSSSTGTLFLNYNSAGSVHINQGGPSSTSTRLFGNVRLEYTTWSGSGSTTADTLHSCQMIMTTGSVTLSMPNAGGHYGRVFTIVNTGASSITLTGSVWGNATIAAKRAAWFVAGDDNVWYRVE